MSGFVHTKRFTRGKLPHWEVNNGRYFVTVRCADSLPVGVIDRLKSVHDALRLIPPQSEQFVALQRQYFCTMEKYLDAGHGQCALGDVACARIVVAELEGLEDWEVDVPHFTIMPNHWHGLIVPREVCSKTLGEIMQRLKGRTSRLINLRRRATGPFWQREWFDRWMRSDWEFENCVRYIRHNPVKAGVVRRSEDHPWTK